MKGLILKDFYCLRTTVKTAVCVSVFSFFLCVMCILSTQYGNLAKLSQELLKDGMDVTDVGIDVIDAGMNADEAGMLWRVLLSTLIFLPMSLAGNVIQCFQEDKKAGFGKVEASLPLSSFSVVTARFGSILFFAGAAFVFSTFLALVSGVLSPDFTAWELARFNAALAGLLLASITVTAFVMYITVSKWVDMLLALPVFAAVLVMNLSAAKSGEGMEAAVIGKILGWVESKFEWFGILGIVVAVCAYVGSILIVRKRRGIR